MVIIIVSSSSSSSKDQTVLPVAVQNQRASDIMNQFVVW
jgi:hypothetical protein